MDQKKIDTILKNIIRQMVKVTRSAFGLTENVESLSANIHEQSVYAANVLEENRDSLHEIKEILEKTSRLSDSAGEADEVSRKGKDKQQHYLEEVKRLSDSIQRGTAFLKEFRKSSEDIARMTQLIMDLSGRLDVLAINGAIEAARRGEAGLGFNVIAREMKTLAQETAVSAESVDKIVRKFETASRDVQELFENSSDSLNKSRKDAGDIYNVFINLQEKNQFVADEVKNINVLIKSLEERNGNRDKSIGKILNVAELSDQQVKQVDQESKDLHRVVGVILEHTGGIHLDWHDKALASLKSIVSNLETPSGTFNSVLEKVFKEYPYMELLYVMDEKGVQVEPNVIHPDFVGQIAGGGDGIDRSNRSYFKQLENGQDYYISGLYVSTAVNHLCLTISVPFFREGKRFVLAADMDLASFVLQE